MQRLKHLFIDEEYKNTFSNLQSCLRINDINEIKDGNHLLYFNMIGLFSFRQWSIQQTIKFFLDYLDILGLSKDLTITIHPDKFESWRSFYPSNLNAIKDLECKWSDGKVGGYCTEFYVNNIEIGNIVNPLESCIDVGFGLERLELILDPSNVRSEIDTLKECYFKLLDNGFKPGPKKQEYIFRKITRLLIKKSVIINDTIYTSEQEKLEKQIKLYHRIKDRNKDKSKEWWYDTHGIDVNEIH